MVYSPSQTQAEQATVSPSPHPEEQTIIFRPYQAQGVRTMALRQYQDQEDHNVNSASFQTQEETTTSMVLTDNHDSPTTSWRAREAVCSSSGIQTTVSAPVVQIISQTTSPEHQPSTVEIELDVELLKPWASQDRYYQQWCVHPLALLWYLKWAGFCGGKCDSHSYISPVTIISVYSNNRLKKADDLARTSDTEQTVMLTVHIRYTNFQVGYIASLKFG